jgi:hypothetical protein
MKIRNAYMKPRGLLRKDLALGIELRAVNGKLEHVDLVD